MEKERANKKSKRTARRMKVRHKIKLLNGWYLPKRKSYSRRPWKYVNPIKRGTLRKERTREAIVESMDGRGSPFYLKRRLQKLRRQQKYLIKKNLYPNKERYLPVRKTQNRVNWLWHFCDVKFSEEYIPIRYRYQWFIKRSGFWSDRGRITTTKTKITNHWNSWSFEKNRSPWNVLSTIASSRNVLPKVVGTMWSVLCPIVSSSWDSVKFITIWRMSRIKPRPGKNGIRRNSNAFVQNH